MAHTPRDSHSQSNNQNSTNSQNSDNIHQASYYAQYQEQNPFAETAFYSYMDSMLYDLTEFIKEKYRANIHITFSTDSNEIDSALPLLPDLSITFTDMPEFTVDISLQDLFNDYSTLPLQDILERVEETIDTVCLATFFKNIDIHYFNDENDSDNDINI